MNKKPRILRRVVLIGASLLLLPLLAWWLVNRVDEAPSAAALRLAEAFPADMDDSDNAWLYLLGLGAAEGTHPIAHGRRRLDAYEARQSAKRDTRGPALDDDLVYLGPDSASDGTDALCALRDADCIGWAWRHTGLLEALAQRNAVLLERFETVLAMPGMQENATPSLDEPLPDLAIAGLHHNLIALQLGDAGRADVGLQRLSEAGAFWRRVSEQARSQFAKRIAGARIEGVYRLLAEWMNEASDSELRAQETRLRELLVEPSEAQRDWLPTLRHEFQQFLNSVPAQLVRGPADLWHCLRTGQRRCVREWSIGQAFAPQATMNLLANQLMARLELHRAPPGSLDEALADVSRVWEAQNPLRDLQSMLQMLAYNATGKTLAAIATPALNYVYEQHDREALRRLLLLKLEAVSRGVELAAIPFFAEGMEGLADPYTGEPFGWDLVRREWLFEPRSMKWKQHNLRLLHAVEAPLPVRACAQVFALQLLLVVEAGERLDLGTLRTCAEGRRDAASLEVNGSAETRGYRTRDSAARLLRVRDENNEPVDRLFFSTTVIAPDESQFEISNVWVTEGMYIELARRGEMAYVAMLDPPADAFVSLHLVNLSLPEVAQALQGVHGARLLGIERLPEDRLTVTGELPLREVIEILADAGGMLVREPEAGRFVFEAAPR